MTQRIVNTALSMTWTGSATQASEITALRALFVPGTVIAASHTNRLATLITNMNGHIHTYEDYYQIADFGNNGDRTNYIQNTNTNSIDSTVAVTGVTAGSTILASKHTSFANACNDLRTHAHGILDRDII